MTSADVNKKIELIRNLLEVAAHPGTSAEEAENATAKAFALMHKYGIDEETARQGNTPTPDEMIIVDIHLSGIYAPVYQTFAYHIGNVVVGVFPAVFGKGSKRGVIYAGIESSVRYAEILLSSLRVQCNTSMEQAFAKLPIEIRGRMTAMERFKWRRSFIEAFGRRVAVRLMETRRSQTAEAEESSPGTEVALIDRQHRAETWAEARLNTSMVKGPQIKSHSYGGASAGVAAGNAASLGGANVTRGAGSQAIGT